MPPKVGNPVGFAFLQIYTLDTNGYATGQAGKSPANGTTSHARLFKHAVSANFNPKASDRVEFRGGDQYTGQYSFGGGELEPFDIECEAFDSDLTAMVSGGLVDVTTNARWNISSTNARNPIPINVGLILTQLYQSREDGSDGIMYYKNTLIPVATVKVLRGGFAFRDKSAWRLNVTPTVANKFPNGVAFGANQGWANNRTDYLDFDSENPIALTAYIGDGTAVTFNTAYKPISTVVTAGNTPNWFARQGTAQVLSSITLAGLATMSAAGSAGNRNILMYETAFEVAA